MGNLSLQHEPLSVRHHQSERERLALGNFNDTVYVTSAFRQIDHPSSVLTGTPMPGRIQTNSESILSSSLVCHLYRARSAVERGAGKGGLRHSAPANCPKECKPSGSLPPLRPLFARDVPSEPSELREAL